MSTKRDQARRAVLEFFAIFLGVSLSFLADDWREFLSERREEKRVMRMIVGDIERDTAEIRLQIRQDSIALAAMQWLSVNWEREGLPPDSLDSAVEGMHHGNPFTPARSGYEGAKSAAHLQLIRDELLRTDVAEYFDRHQPKQVVYSEFTHQFDWVLWELLRPAYAFPAGDPRGLRSMQGSRMWPALRTDNSVRSAIVQAAFWRSLSIGQARRQLERAVELRGRLQDHLDE